MRRPPPHVSFRACGRCRSAVDTTVVLSLRSERLVIQCSAAYCNLVCMLVFGRGAFCPAQTLFAFQSAVGYRELRRLSMASPGSECQHCLNVL